jgi:hypothetical protein
MNPSRVLLAALLVWTAAPARADDDAVVDGFRAAAQKQKALAAAAIPPGPCAAPSGAAGRTEFYDAKQNLLFASAGGCKEDAIVVLTEAKNAGEFKRLLGTKCPAGTALDACRLRGFGQAYAFSEFVAFDAPHNRVSLGNGILAETKTYLYRDPEDALIHIGREKLVGSGTDVYPTDPNRGGTGYKTQSQAQGVGDLHTHPNSGKLLTSGSEIGVARHHPSPADTSETKIHDYFDVVVSPLYVYFINNRFTDSMVFSRKDAFGDNAAKAYLQKDREAETFYDQHHAFPAWYHDYAQKNNPWSQ